MMDHTINEAEYLENLSLLIYVLLYQKLMAATKHPT